MPRHIRSAGDPNRLAFTLGYPPFVAVSVGDKYLLTFDTTRVNEDLGLTFPEDYGQIAGFQWLPNLVLLVGLTNGYIVTVDFGALIKLQQSHKLPDRVSAMGTTKVFNEYLQDLSAFYTSATGQRVACCGDTAVKIVHRTGVELEVHLEVALDRKPTIGEYLDKVIPRFRSSRPTHQSQLRSNRAHATRDPHLAFALRPVLPVHEACGGGARRSSGTTAPRLSRAPRLTASCTCTSCSTSTTRCGTRLRAASCLGAAPQARARCLWAWPLASGHAVGVGGRAQAPKEEGVRRGGVRKSFLAGQARVYQLSASEIWARDKGGGGGRGAAWLCRCPGVMSVAGGGNRMVGRDPRSVCEMWRVWWSVFVL